MMDRQSPGEKQPDIRRTVATPIPPAAITMATVSPSNTTCTQASSTSLSVISSNRPAVQVIQHTIHRPQNMAAQYLHQMYAAQQQHLMLQTAALQQHQHNPRLQSLATVQQASACLRQSPSTSSHCVVHQPAGVSQSPVTLPASPVTAHLTGQSQTSGSSGAATTLSQQAMLLGNRPANCNQAQMYLRAQMLILTPAATVAAVQSDLPHAVTSGSSLPTSSQVQNLALRGHLPGGLAAAHSGIMKPSAQSQAVTPAVSLSKTSICLPKTNQLTDTSTETGLNCVTRLASGPQIINPVQTHSPVKQQLYHPPGRCVEHQHLIFQKGSGGTLNHRAAHPEANSVALPLSVNRLNPPGASSLSVTSVSGQASIPAATIQPQPPPLVAAPQHRTSFPPAQTQPPPPPPPLVLPRLPQNPPVSLQRLYIHSAQALDIQTGRIVLTEQQLPVAEALVKMPYQNLPPPQTMPVDLKVHPVRRNESPLSGKTCKVNGLSLEERKDESPRRERTPTPLTGSPKLNGAAAMVSSSIISSRSVIRSPLVEEPSQPTSRSRASSEHPPLPPPPASPPLPPTILPAGLRVPRQPSSSPTGLPGSPDRMFKTHVLTHLIEGFVIREGLEPFPVVNSSRQDKQATLPECWETQTSVDAAAEDSLLDADQSDSSDSEMENDSPAADVLGLQRAADVLQCEFCSSRGYAHAFLRSKRFCSMACVRRSSVSGTKRISMLRARRWGHRPAGRRGRPPSRVNGASRQHLPRQAHRSIGSVDARDEEKEDGPPVPMTTRLRKQAERALEREREREQRLTETISISDGEVDIRSPSQWNVEEVFSHINSLPGGEAVADEFRSQEIDGQSLLLLTEDHLVSTMNLKLGPALRLCAHINSLKDA